MKISDSLLLDVVQVIYLTYTADFSGYFAFVKVKESISRSLCNVFTIIQPYSSD